MRVSKERTWRTTLRFALIAVALFVTTAASAASCEKAFQILGPVVEKLAVSLRVSATVIEQHSQALIDAGKVTEAALAEALPVAANEASRWDQAVSRARSLVANTVDDATLSRIVQGTACDALTDAMNGKTPDFTTLVQKNATIEGLAPERLSEIIGAAAVVQATYAALQDGSSPHQAMMAARVNIECALAGR
jgi:hypothetical protein